MKYIKLKILLACAVSFLLASCGGKTVTETIGGRISGLSSGTTLPLILQNNSGDNFTANGNETFTFATPIDVGSTYDVTVYQQPTGETCVVENPTGTVEQSIGNVDSVVVICTPALSAANEVFGTVTGLASGSSITLSINGIDPIVVYGASSGNAVSFNFLPLATGTEYSVEVSSKPTGVTCTLSNNAGTIPTTTAVVVSCT
ncbi:MAG: hypothetical protein P4L91_11420 [Burkholderiaceae bacterium]|nr:hypothetical protein [Burkholderiaceae bacterium]